MSHRPVIGITVGHEGSGAMPPYSSPPYYALSVERAGGIPLLLPYRSPGCIDDYLSICSGFVLVGSDDYDPMRWNEPRDPRAKPIDPAREVFDFALIDAIDRAGVAVLGICGGCQLMNLHRGGSLVQFIPDLALEPRVEHRRFDAVDWARRHEAHVAPGSLLEQITGKSRLVVNTAHKQAIRTLGTGLVATAHASDGIIEAIEDRTKRFWLGTQWHPERMLDERDQEVLFEGLTRASSRH